MEVVDRENLFEEPVAQDAPLLDLNLVIEQVDVEIAPQEEEEPGLEEFCLFGGETISVSQIDAPEEEETFQGRPQTYYFYSSTPEFREKCRLVAVDGDMAAQWVHRESTAPDINADYKPRKKCRPGSATRRNKVARNKQRDQEKKDHIRMQRLKRSRARR